MSPHPLRSLAATCLGLVLTFPLSLLAGNALSPADALHCFITASDLSVELVAAEPLVSSPCALAFDGPHRLYVAENNGYPSDGSGLGNIVLLEDTDKDGVMDQRTVYASGLAFPNGVLPFRGGLLVTASPDLLFLKDTDGDGKADQREVWITGFDTTKSTQLRVNKPMLGPDGWIYLAAGLVGGELTRPTHPKEPAFKMTGDIRIHPDSREVRHAGGKSQYGQTFDNEGRRFICMNRIPVQHVVLQPEWLGANPRLAFAETVQDCNPRLVKSGFAGDKGGVRLHPVSSNITTADSHTGSFSAACGVHIFQGTGLPKRYQHAVFSCDPTGNLVHADLLTPDGASFHADPLLADHEPVASTDDWFRPVFLTTGPDGCLYIADMYRSTIEHPDYLPEEVRKRTDFVTGRDRGRIWRVRSSGRPSPEPINHSSSASKVGTAFATLARGAASRERLEIPRLASLAREGISDRWVRALAVSQINGREDAFLSALWPLVQDEPEGSVELLTLTAKSFETNEKLLGALSQLTAGPIALEAALVSELKTPANHEVITKAATKALVFIQKGRIPSSSAKTLFGLAAKVDASQSFPALLDVWKAPHPNDIRAAAFRTMAAIAPLQAAETAITPSVWTSLSPELREVVLTSLTSNPAKPEAILQLVESGIVKASSIPSRIRQNLLKNPPSPLADRMTKSLAVAGSSKAETDAKIAEALKLPFDGRVGKSLFGALCSACHRLEQTGSVLGPDLYDMRRQTKEMIAFHIANPDAEVAPAYTGYTVSLRSGSSLTGLVAGETSDNVTLRMPGGASETIRRSDVSALAPLPGSIMPPGLLDGLTAQQVADLLAFLKGQ